MLSSQPSTRVATDTQNSPYVGPRPFTTGDRDIFFGRNQEAIELTSLVKAHPEVLLYAQSGAGKTSLLFAQVIPILDTEEEFDVLPTARVRSQESSTIPDEKISNIYMFNALKDLSDDQLSVIERSQFTLAEYLKRRPRSAVRFPEGAAGNGNDGSPELRLPRVVIFDQFEEIFTLHPERYKDRQDFFMQVSEALKDDPFLRIVFSMREDYIAEVDPYVDILPQSLRTRFRLERLRKANAISAVKQPLETDRVKNSSRHFADGAAELLVDRLMLIKVKTASGEKIEVPGEFVDPVQLQVVCQTLWDKLPPEKTIIAKEDLDKYANVDEALSDFYETSVRKAVTSANNASQAAAATNKSAEVVTITEGVVRLWFGQKLITREDKRNMVFREAQTTAGLSNLVVDELENQHLIRVEMRGGEPWYELSHDRFIPPIRESNRRFLLQQPLAKRKAQELEERADKWRESQRNDSLLLNRAELLDAQNWMRTEAAAIGYSETLFSLVRASEAAIEHEDSKQRQMLADALAQKAEALAQKNEALALQADAEQKRSRQWKIGLVGASLLLVIAFASAGFAFIAKGKANAALAKATDEEAKAQTALARETLASNREREARNKAEEVAKKLDAEKIEADKARGNADAARVLAEREKVLAQEARGETEAALKKSQDYLKQSQDSNEQLTGFAAKLEKGEQNALSLKLAADSNSVLVNDPELSLRLAIEALKHLGTEQAAYMLRTSYLKSRARRILTGHDGIVWQGAYSPDGKTIVTGGEDGRLRIWDAKTGREIQVLPKPKDSEDQKVSRDRPAPVHGLVISPDGSRIATEVNDGKGRIWNVAGGDPIELPDLTGPLAVLAFSPDGKLLATEATSDQKKPGYAPRIWDASTGKVVATLSHDDATSALAFSPNGKLLATASWDKTAKIWEAKTGRLLRVLSGHASILTSIAFAPDGKTLVTGSYDGTAKIWDTETGRVAQTLKGHIGAVHEVCFSMDGRFIAAAGGSIPAKISSGEVSVEIESDVSDVEDNAVMVWQAETGDLVSILSGHTGALNSIQFNSDRKEPQLVTASEDGTARVWDAATGKLLNELRGHGGSVKSAAFSPDNQSVVTSGADATAQVWTIVDPFMKVQFAVHGGALRDVKFNSNGSTVSACMTDGSIREFRLTGEPKSVLKVEPPVPVNDLAASPDGRFIVTASTRASRGRIGNSNARVWDTMARKFINELTTGEPVTKVSYSPKGTYVLTVTQSGVVQLWSTSDWNKQAMIGHAQSDSKRVPVSDVDFDPSEKYIATALANGEVYISEMSTGATVRVIKAHDVPVDKVSFSSDGQKLVTAGADGTAKVWTIDGKLVATLSGHNGAVYSAAFSQDGAFVVTSGVDGTVRVWEAETGARVAELREPDIDLTSARFSPDNKSIVASSGIEGMIYIFDCQVCRPIDQMKTLAIESNPRQLTDKERKLYLGDEPEKEFSP